MGHSPRPCGASSRTVSPKLGEAACLPGPGEGGVRPWPGRDPHWILSWDASLMLRLFCRGTAVGTFADLNWVRGTGSLVSRSFERPRLMDPASAGTCNKAHFSRVPTPFGRHQGAWDAHGGENGSWTPREPSEIMGHLAPRVGSAHSSSVPGDESSTQRVPTYQTENLRLVGEVS